jgi:hypothetical protein
LTVFVSFETAKGMTKRFVAALMLGLFLLNGGCQTLRNGETAVEAWAIAHRSQIEQTIFVVGKNVGQDALRVYLGGTSSTAKFNFAAGLRSIEGSYTSPDQVNSLLSVWGVKSSPFSDAASFLAADLANHPPKNKDQAVARFEGYITGIAPSMGVAPAQQPKG